jgi:cupin superfamily acireductone dioxygenase involved in methionine salvage
MHDLHDDEMIHYLLHFALHFDVKSKSSSSFWIVFATLQLIE